VKVSQGEVSSRRLTVAGSLVLVVLLVLPASAAASTRSQSATAAGPGAIATATAKCPRGQRATGGGFTFPLQTGEPRLEVYESRKVGQRSWRASAQIFDEFALGTARTITAFAYCRDGAPATKSKSASVTSVGDSFAFFAADARCTAGKAQAGGFRAPSAQNQVGVDILDVMDSYRAGRKTWRSRMASGASGTTFTSYVYCADEKKPAARSGSVTTAASQLPVTALSAECKRGTRPVAGGFSQPNASRAPQGLFFGLHESFKSGKRWRVSGVHSSGGGSTTLNSIAYCA
jgi:hypothetical protein